MARGIYFTVRGNRRFKINRKRNKKLRFIILAAVLLLIGTRVALQYKPVAAVEEAAGISTSNLFIDTVYKRIVSFVIPGISDVTDFVIRNDHENVAEQASQIVVLPNLRDPKLIVLAQLPFLIVPAIVPQQLADEEPDSATEPRKITIPVRQELTGEGKVIIYHTHATESFVPTSGKTFTQDLSLTVAQLGKELAEVLQRNYQIPVIHNNTIHDIPRKTAYEMARPTLEKLLRENPDTELVIDLHRDGVVRGATTGILNGQPAARILFVVGTRYPGFEENLRKAQFLHQALEEIAPGISRGIRERPFIYNQNYHMGSLLIELGGHENSLEEARLTLPVLAEALNRLYNSGS